MKTKITGFHQDEYKYIIINDNLEDCANEIIKIIADERS